MTISQAIHPVDALFRKESTGFNPFSTRRDWAIFGALLAVILAGVVLGGYRFGFTIRLLPIVTGSLAGMLPSLLRLLPVRGVVPAGARNEWLAQLAESRFMPAAGAPGEQRFMQDKGPRWLRWDASSASLRHRPDGDYDATVPLHIYRAAKRRVKGKRQS